MNNDRFKFRVWLPDENRYLHNTDCPVIDSDGNLMWCYLNPFGHWEHHKMEDAVIEQCTGLADKNGNLIYEGDVVRVEDECGICDPMMNCDTGIGFITWECEMWYIDRNVNLGLYDTKQVNYIEIIGNIHDDQFRDATKKMEGEQC